MASVRRLPHLLVVLAMLFPLVATAPAGAAAGPLTTGVVAGSDTSTLDYGYGYGKPNQSRIWFNSARSRWDALVPRSDAGSSDHYILEDVTGAQVFTPLELEDRDTARVDAYWNDATRELYVLGTHVSSTEFWRVAYDASTDTYSPVVGVAGAGVVVPGMAADPDPGLAVSTNEPGTVYVTPDGDVWAAVMNEGALLVQHSADGGATWMNDPVTLDSSLRLGLTTWVHFENGGTTYVGLFAGENGEGQASSRNVYYYIDQNADPAVYTNWINDSANIPAAFGTEQSDDHVRAARDAAGNQYFVVKTEGGSAADPVVKLFKRTPGGAWSAYKVHLQGATPEQTRPSLVVDDQFGDIYIFSTDTFGGNGTQVSAPLTNLDALETAPRITVFRSADGPFDDIIAPRQSVSAATGIALLVHNLGARTVWYASEPMVPVAVNATVPLVTGLTRSAAEAAIVAASLAVGTVTTAPSAVVPAGSVISQNPIAGTVLPAGSPVDLLVSTGASSSGATVGVVRGSDTSSLGVLYGKPNQSRLWFNSAAGRWDALVPKFDGGTVSQSDHYIVADVVGSQTFTPLELEDRDTARVDAYWNDAAGKLYVLGSHGTTSEFWRVGFTGGAYTTEVGVPGQGVSVPGITQVDDNEPATVYATPNGHVWVAVLKAGALDVQHSADGGATWMKEPIRLNSTIHVGLTTWVDWQSGGKTYVGLFTGENGEDNFASDNFFYFIDQNANPAVLANWVNDSASIPAPFGTEMSDDHVRAARDKAGNQYFVVKTEGGQSTDPVIKLFKRTPAGVWSQYPVHLQGTAPEQTRPSLAIDDENREIYIFTTDTFDGNGTQVKASLDRLGDLVSAPRTTLFYRADGPFNDIIAPRQSLNSTTDLAVLVHNTFTRSVWYGFEDITPAPQASVPAVIGLTETAARTAIQNAGLVVGTVTSITDPTAPIGTVIDQKPAAGTLVAPGSAVNLVVSSGRAAPAQSVSAFAPVADAFVDQDKPTENKGTDDKLKVKTEAGKNQLSYLRFNVSGVSGTVTNATLYLYAKDDAPAGVSVYSVNGAWDELGVTYTNRPALGGIVGRSGGTRNDRWVAIDVTSAVTGNGAVNLALLGAGQKVEFSSREKTEAPLLVVNSSTAGVRPAAVSAISAVNPVADAYVDQDKPKDNKGTDDKLKVKTEPGKDQVSYLQFTVPATGTVTRATLYLYAKADSPTGVEVRSVSGSWAEKTVTYNNRPTLGGVVGRSGGTRSDNWVSIDVTSAVAGSGAVNLALVGQKVEFSSREKTEAPLLVVETSAGAVRPAALSGITAVNPIADTFVDQDHPSDNEGTDDKLKAKTEAGKDQVSYLRFNVPSGTVARATLYLYAKADSPTGVQVNAVTGSWTETGVTYNNRPALGAVVGRSGGTKNDNWVAIDVTGAVTAGGTLDLALVDTGTKVEFSSREKDEAPLLIIETR